MLTNMHLCPGKQLEESAEAVCQETHSNGRQDGPKGDLSPQDGFVRFTLPSSTFPIRMLSNPYAKRPTPRGVKIAPKETYYPKLIKIIPTLTNAHCCGEIAEVSYDF
jgi:hypothetical protein